MSGRVKKTTTTTVTTTKTSAAAGAASPALSTSSPRPGRPQSPTMISRVQEKNELASLNDRLAAYIERVRQLETENTRLTRIVQSQEDTVTREVSGIKGLYEGELASARKMLDDLAKDKAKLQFENGKLKGELDELREKLRAKEKDLAGVERRVVAAEAQVNELQARLNDAVNERRKYEDDYNKLKKEFDLLSKSHLSAKKQLEDETIARVDLENRIQSLKEELSFKSQIHEQELNESVSRSRVVVEEVDGRLQSEYNSRLAEALREMREDNDQQLRQMRDETEALFERKLVEMRELSSRSVDTSDKSQSELRNARKRLDELQSDLQRLTSQNQSYESRIRDLENQLRREQDSHAADHDSLTAEIQRLRAAMEDQLREYRDLMDVKIQLDAEIAAYRKLLESEETRLNLSAVEGTPGRTPATEPSRKRKRIELDETDAGKSAARSIVSKTQSSSDYTTSSAAKDVVEISETCSDGKFIKLTNTSADKDVSLGNWQLKHVAGDQEAIFKFHRQTHLKPQATVTIWSSDSKETHQPPSQLVMKEQKWPTGDEMKTMLMDAKGEEVASREMKRSTLRTASMFVQQSAVETSGSQKQTPARKGIWGLFSSVLM